MRHVLLPPALGAASASAGRIVALQGDTMGTSWSLRYVASTALAPAEIRQRLQARLDGLVGEMSSWQAESDLCRYNATAAGHWCALPDDFFTVLCAALTLAAETDGAYDPSAGPLVDLWGFGPPGEITAPPSPARIADARARVGWRQVQLDTTHRRVLQPGGVQLDLSAIAKGYAVDALSQLLREAGIEHHLVEIGGELRGQGLKPDGQPWWVQLEVPAAPGLPLPEMVVALHGLAIATSGDYRQGFEHEGHRYSHTLDPRSGRPLQHDLAAVTVLHAEALKADAIATALMVLGLDAGLAWAERRGVAARFVQRTREGLRQQWSSRLAAMMS